MSNIILGNGFFWQNVPLALIMSLCLRRGMAVKPITRRPPSDIFGLVAGGSGLALIYAALDQGNRLDWLNSGLVWGLLSAGGLLLSWPFSCHEARHRSTAPESQGRLQRAALPSRLPVLASVLRLTVTSAGFFIPLFRRDGARISRAGSGRDRSSGLRCCSSSSARWRH